MLKNPTVRFLRANSSLLLGRPALMVQISQIPKRFNSSSTDPNQEEQKKRKEDRAVNFRNFISVGIIATILLTQVVDAVNKEKPRPKTNISESEYFKQQQRLKRKTTLFESNEKQVYFLKTEQDIKDIDGLEEFTVIDPKELLELEKNDEKSRFHALLNDPDTVEIPRGLVIDLIGQFLKNKPDGKFLVLNYPVDVKESVRFEEKVVTIKKLIYLNNQEDKQTNDVVKYYQTVDKVTEIKSIDQLKESLQ